MAGSSRRGPHDQPPAPDPPARVQADERQQEPEDGRGLQRPLARGAACPHDRDGHPRAEPQQAEPGAEEQSQRSGGQVAEGERPAVAEGERIAEPRVVVRAVDRESDGAAEDRRRGLAHPSRPRQQVRREDRPDQDAGRLREHAQGAQAGRPPARPLLHDQARGGRDEQREQRLGEERARVDERDRTEPIRHRGRPRSLGRSPEQQAETRDERQRQGRAQRGKEQCEHRLDEVRRQAEHCRDGGSRRNKRRREHRLERIPAGIRSAAGPDDPQARLDARLETVRDRPGHGEHGVAVDRVVRRREERHVDHEGAECERHSVHRGPSPTAKVGRGASAVVTGPRHVSWPWLPMASRGSAGAGCSARPGGAAPGQQRTPAGSARLEIRRRVAESFGL